MNTDALILKSINIKLKKSKNQRVSIIKKITQEYEW